MGLVHIFWAIGLICCLILFIQDFKDRMVGLGWLILCLISGLGYNWKFDPYFLLQDVLANGLILALLLVATILIIWLRKGSFKMDTQLGWGDIGMFVVLATWLPTSWFLLFFSLGNLLIILASLAFIHLRGLNPATFPIPLAGAQSLLLMLFLILKQSDHLPNLWI